MKHVKDLGNPWFNDSTGQRAEQDIRAYTCDSFKGPFVVQRVFKIGGFFE
jgi:hypothetical protein